MSGTELAASDSELDRLAARWRSGWTGEGFAACTTPDVTYEDALTTAPLEGIVALEGRAAQLRTVLPDLRAESTSPPLGRGNHVCVPWRLRGTHEGDSDILPATGRLVIVDGLHYVELSDGLVRRARGFFDLYDTAVQLGLLPGRGGMAEAALLLVRGFGLRRRTDG